MPASFLLALREGMEAALIVGIIIGALMKLHYSRLLPAVWLGVLAASLLSLLTSIALYRFGLELEGDAEKMFEGVAMVLAAGVLTWMIFWMQRQSMGMRQALARQASAAGEQGFWAIFTLAFITVIREGIELGLFLAAAAFATDGVRTLVGALFGLLAAVSLGWLLYRSSIHLNLRRFFSITSKLLLIFAAGLVAHGVHEFNELGWIPPIVDPIWNINSILDEASPLGQMLNALFGYNGNPSLTEVLAYLGYLAIIIFMLRLMAAPPPRQLAS